MIKTDTDEIPHAAGAAAFGAARLCDPVFRWDLDSILGGTAAREGWSRAYALEVDREYRKFVYVSIKYPGEKLGMAGPVDQLWHDHILNTCDYLEFCRVLAGRYLHHVPTGPANGDRDGVSYARTLALIERDFGAVNWSVWPKAGESETDCCTSCSHIAQESAPTFLS